ncbi:DUF6538 domain-containing protein [uncultured Tateyamaria sp.]|uniref:DUF6538 domain-containing protein n=1 Tax=uncultured Tateyamaria sp. TaxID=455651 RepID=UPI0026356FA4|nr:DUF6538 domain-containing protein [uncultured Tateyamaria sp.]
MTIKKRGKKFSLYKRVPKRYASIEPRTFVWCSLGTDSEREAAEKAPLVWSQMLDGWEAKLKGDTQDAKQRFEAARELASARGFRYMPAEKIIEDTEQIVDRVESISGPLDTPDHFEAVALLGRVEPPALKISECLELYWELARDKTQGKSDDQLRRWKNPRIKAVKNFIEVCGDKAIANVTADDMLDYRAWWMDKIEREGLANTSANKDFIHLGDVLKTVNKLKRLGITLPLSGLSFKKGELALTEDVMTAREVAGAAQVIHLRSGAVVALVARKLADGFRYQMTNTSVAIGGHQIAITDLCERFPVAR